MRALLSLLVLVVFSGCEQTRAAKSPSSQPCACDAAQGTPHKASRRTEITR